MSKVFRVYVANGGDSGFEMDLPATDYQMLDALDKLHLAPGELPYLEILQYYDFEYLDKCMASLGSLYELNGLAKKLSNLSPAETAGFEGLVGKELQKGTRELPLSKLIDFAYNAVCCHVVPEAVTDYQLGKFYAENGFVPEVDDLSDAAFDLLDFGKIGRDYRTSEGGVFTSWGYVIQNQKLRLVFEELDFMPHKPDYVFRLTLVNAYAEQRPQKTSLDLPATDAQMVKTLKQLGASDWGDIALEALDGPLTSMDHDLFYMDELSKLNELAKRIQKIETVWPISQYKAILCAMDCHDIDTAIALAETVDDFYFDPCIRTPNQVATEELRLMMGAPEKDLLAKHLDLYSYGRDLIAHYNEKLTEYGLLERKDGQPIQSRTIQPQMGGMEMQ